MGGGGLTGFNPPPVVLCTLEPILDVSGEANFGAFPLPPVGASGVVDLTAEDSKLRGSVFRDNVERGNFPPADGGGGGWGLLPLGPDPPV